MKLTQSQLDRIFEAEDILIHVMREVEELSRKPQSTMHRSSVQRLDRVISEIENIIYSANVK